MKFFEFMFVPTILFIVIVLPVWISMHYSSLKRSSRSLSKEDRVAKPGESCHTPVIRRRVSRYAGAKLIRVSRLNADTVHELRGRLLNRIVGQGQVERAV